MPTELIIVGAGGSSREIADAIRGSDQLRSAWRLLGYLDDDPAKTGRSVDDLSVLGTTQSASRYSTASFVVGVASYKNPATRRAIVEGLGLPAERYATLVHPSASVSSHARLGHGTVVLQGVVITPATVIGSHVLVCQGVQLTHDVSVADYVTFAPGAVACGGVTIGPSAYVGAGALIAPGVSVGPESLIGIGAVVTRPVVAGATVFGNPARMVNMVGNVRRWTKQ
jgi:sugar O-acyltransferase (sialic acid O-acetyltransferase NeuD family)